MLRSMFRCEECGKEYATRGTLTRHTKNHEATQTDVAHQCHICRVSFRRRDLLRRHSKTVHSHVSHASGNGNTTGDRSSVTSKTRQRRHTACEKCRASRSRCNGGQPCSRCASIPQSGASDTCVYRSSGGRTSQDAAVQSSSAVPVDQSSFGSPVTSSAPVTNIESFPLHDASPQVADMPTQGLQGLADGDVAALHSVDTAAELMTTTFWPFATAWQWEHEGLYLHGSDDILSDIALETIPSQPLAESMSNPVGLAGYVLLPESPVDVPSHDISNIAGSGNDLSRDLSGLKSIVRAMVDFAANTALSYELAARLPHQWQHYALQLSNFIAPEGYEPERDGVHLLEHLTKQYFDNFHPLWPLIPRDTNIETSVHPLLYLTLTSIGALYAGTTAAASYGSQMHQRIRKILTHRSTRRDTHETHALDVGRAMLLAQVTALYFEQNGAFSAALRLGATLHTHAHRMRLFTMRGEVCQPAVHRQSLSIVEGRKMLAYGMLRAETFMSVLFNRKPLIGSEEINIPLPLDQQVSGPKAKNINRFLRTPAGGLHFSDLVRLILEPEEALPTLTPAECELLLFGLQHEVWRFSHDPELFERLICAPSSSSDYLDLTVRREMKTLKSEHARVLAALRRWRGVLAKCQLDYLPEQNRTTFLSGLVLHELSLLRLFAPLEAIQQTAYQSQKLPAGDEQEIALIQRWSRSDNAMQALRPARDIWRMLQQETSRSRDRQAKYNILALIALTHAAAVLWALIGLEALPHELLTDSDGFGHVRLQRANNRTLMLLFADIYPKITSTWGLQSSFSKVVRNLADSPFPGPLT